MSDTELSPEAQEILNQSAAFTRTQDFLRAMATMDNARIQTYRTCDDYYTGENQRVRLTDRVRRYLQVSGFMFCENFCEVIVDALCERLIIEKVSSENDEIQEWVDQWLKDVRFDEVQSVVHTNTAIKGDGYVIVELDTRLGRPSIHWNRPEIIKPIYDSEHPESILFASKVWKSKLETPTNPNQRPITRMNLYFPDSVEKWFTEASDTAGMWTKHLDPGDGVWPIPWLASDNEPLGVPVFHFRNKSKGKTWGVSEIRGTIPQQDALNKSLVDLAMVLDQHGFPQRWGTGIKKEERGTLTTAAGTMWLTANQDAKFGQFDIPAVTNLLAAVEAQLQRIAGRSRTPLFLLVLSGDAPSGESLKTAETGLVKKAKDRQVPIGNKWEDVFVMCAKVAQANGDLMGVDIMPDLFDIVWVDPESRNVLEQTTALAQQVSQLGLSKDTALTELGYNSDEERDKKDEETQVAMAQFNAGMPTAPLYTASNPSS